MLDLINKLAPFFEDCYKEISVRQFARIVRISPPAASSFLKKCESEGFLSSRKIGIYLFFKANRNSYVFQNFAKCYWYERLHSLTGALHEEINYSQIILFGSASKAENTSESDLDIFVNFPKTNINGLGLLQKKLKRRVELHFREEQSNPHLKKNIAKGVAIR